MRDSLMSANCASSKLETWPRLRPAGGEWFSARVALYGCHPTEAAMAAKKPAKKKVKVADLKVRKGGASAVKGGATSKVKIDF